MSIRVPRKGDSVKYSGLHPWVNKYKPKPVDGLCEFCHIRPHEDLACVTGLYVRDFNNWKYLCTKCHTRYDNDRLGLSIPANRRCVKCNSSKTSVYNGLPFWYVVDEQANLYRCRHCYYQEYWVNKKGSIDKETEEPHDCSNR